MKKLSIVVPVYNVEKYLEDCVRSLLEQEYKNIEIILVNDGSKDKSGLICDNLASRYKCITVIHQKNKGLPEARNTGLRCATGEYIAFIDSDDLVHLKMFSELIKNLEKTNSDIAICNFTIFNKKTKYKVTRYQDEVIDYTDEKSLFFYKCSMDGCTNRVFKRNSIVDNDIWFISKSIVSQEDYYFQMKVFTKIKRIVTISKGYYLYRERKSSITKSGQDVEFAKRCLDFLVITKEYILNNSKRNIEMFLNYQYANMLLASINNVKFNSIKEILKIIKLFCGNKKIYITKSTINILFPGNSFQEKYYRSILFMLNNNLNYIVAFLEKLRIKKLRSSLKTDNYYE